MLSNGLHSLASGDSGLVQQPNWCVFITLITCTRVNLEARLLGDIVRCEEMYDRGRRYYLLTFATQDSAKWVLSMYAHPHSSNVRQLRKALCMTGYNVDGVPL